MKELVSVIIPILNPDLNPVEERILHHSLEMLANYPIIFITFPNADLSIVREHQKEIDVVYFAKEYFQSRQALAKLFLMSDFYEQFSWSSFLLVHELNSWVLKDELHYWCKQGYDYLRAAPLLPHDFSLSKFQRIKGLDQSDRLILGNSFQDNGLYLCLVERMAKSLKNKQKKAYEYRHDDKLANGDAVFWEAEVNRFWPNLRRPTAIVQNYFAQHADQQVSLITGIVDKLPFALTGINNKNIERLPH